jgi:hypothetical protein
MSADEICKVIGSGRGEGKPIAKTTLFRHFRKEDAIPVGHQQRAAAGWYW